MIIGDIILFGYISFELNYVLLVRVICSKYLMKQKVELVFTG